MYFGGYGIPPDPRKVDESCGFFKFNTSVEDQFTVSFLVPNIFQRRGILQNDYFPYQSKILQCNYETMAGIMT